VLLFEWDPNKATENLETHGVSFDEASMAFRDTLSLTTCDPLHSTERGDFIRLISVRKATKKERKQYEENAKRSRHA
jgi:hypothetical protein